MEVKEPSAKYLARPAYKQTDVGALPEDWEPIAAAEFVDPNAPICYGVVQVGQDVSDGVPIVAIKYVKEISFAPLHRTAPALERPYSRSRVQQGDVLISVKGTIGRVGIVPKGFKGNISRELARLRPKQGYSAEYIGHQLEADVTQARISRAVVGTTRLEFSIATLRKFALPIPGSLSEQTTIAEALSDADALIESLEQLLAKKRLIKQGAMQELLTGQKRLPGFAGEWKVERLCDIAHIKTGGRNNEDKMEDGEFPFFVRSPNVERINSYSHDCEAILVPGEGNIGSIFHYVNGRFNVHQRVYAITQFSPDASGRYVHLYMTMNFGAHAMQNSVKATVDSLRLPTFQQFEVALPPTIEEQTAIATILSDMDAELAVLDAKLAKARDLKQGMMQELLTGRIRLL
jgi:type I restriction enzyme S subunit